MFSPRLLVPCLLLLLATGQAEMPTCVCEVARPESLGTRECSLCRVAEAQPSGTLYFTIPDASPNKPNRLLAMPRYHGMQPEHLGNMTAEQRAALWTFAIAKAHEVWGDQWGLAVNSVDRRSQCHMHVHIGKLLEEEPGGTVKVVDKVEDLPVPDIKDGILVHPVGGKLHAHIGNAAPELLLQR